MLSADVVRMAAQGAVALLVLTHTAHIWELVVLQALAGTATAFFNPASTGLTPMTISPGRLQQANALRGLSMASAGIVGTAIGGGVVVAVGPGWALAVDAASFAASAFFLAQLRLPPHVKLEPQSFLADLHDGWREFSSRTWVWVIVLAASIGNMMRSVFVVLGAVISKQSLGGPLAWTVILAGLGVGSLIGGIVVAARPRPSPALLRVRACSASSRSRRRCSRCGAPAVVVAAGALLAGGANMIFNALWETSLQRHVPRRRTVPRQRLRLVRVARVPADRARARRTGRRRVRHEHDALDRRRRHARRGGAGRRDPERQAARDSKASKAPSAPGLAAHLRAVDQTRPFAADRSAEVVELRAIVVARLDPMLLTVEQHDAGRIDERLRHLEHARRADHLDPVDERRREAALERREDVAEAQHAREVLVDAVTQPAAPCAASGSPSTSRAALTQ